MNKNYAKDLFQLQSELIDTKVDMTVGKAIDRIIEKINDVRHEIHAEFQSFKHEMHVEFQEFKHEIKDQFVSLDKRVLAIEIKLGMIGDKKKSIYDRVLDYTFKAGYGILTFISIYFAFLLTQIHFLH